MDEQLLKKPYTEKLFVKPNIEQFAEGKLEFTDPNRKSDGEFLGTRSRINEEELATYLKEKESETGALLEKYKVR